MRKITFVLYLILLTGCKQNYESLYYTKSYERFQDSYNYDERIKNAQQFFLEFATSFHKTILDSFPNFKNWDSLITGNPFKSKLTLYLSNTREEFLMITKNGAPELRVEVTDYPVQLALGHKLDFNMEENKKEPIHFDISFLLKEYDNKPPAISLQDAEYKFFADEFLQSPNSFIGLGKSCMGIMNNVVFEGTRGGPITTFKIHDIGFLTVFNGFEYWSSKAAGLGERLALSQIKKLYLGSSFFQKALANKYLAAIANEILLKEQKTGTDGLSTYTSYEFQLDNQRLLDAAKYYKQDEAYIHELSPFQKKDDKPTASLLAHSSGV